MKAGQPCGVLPAGHFSTLTRPSDSAGTMLVQAEQQRESEGGGGLFSCAHTSGAAAFTQSKAHGRGSRLLPALPASVTPATISLVSQQAKLWTLWPLYLIRMCGESIFSWHCEICRTVWHMLRGYLLAV